MNVCVCMSDVFILFVVCSRVTLRRCWDVFYAVLFYLLFLKATKDDASELMM